MYFSKANHGSAGRIAVVLTVVFCAISVLAQTESGRLSDSEIAAAVRGVLMGDPGVEASQIDVSSEQGVVTLSGRVGNLLTRDRSQRLAQAVRGVRAVVNQLNTKPSERVDLILEQDIKDALLRNAVTDAWQIDVAVSDAEATLNGSVNSWQKKQMAERIAKRVRGIRSINNQIVVVYGQSRPDGQIRDEVRSRLRWDALIDDAMIEVAVQDGEVRLSGMVGSMAEKTRATTDAWVSGVEEVDADALSIAPWEEHDNLRGDKYEVTSDAAVEKAVQDALVYDPRVSLFDIEVSVNEGRVTLSGSVNSLAAKRAAGQDARNTVGVWSVANLIQVRPEAGLSDDDVAKRVRDALHSDPYTEAFEINVRVNQGKVYLNGTVDSLFEKMHAEYVVSDITGVKDVFNRLETDRDEIYGYDPHSEQWYNYDYRWYEGPGRDSGLSDWEIAQQIKHELFWSPFVQEKDVQVSVDDGKAQLTGKVDTWGERKEATENAYEGGAIAVDNDLRVQYGPDYYKP